MLNDMQHCGDMNSLNVLNDLQHCGDMDGLSILNDIQHCGGIHDCNMLEFMYRWMPRVFGGAVDEIGQLVDCELYTTTNLNK